MLGDAPIAKEGDPPRVEASKGASRSVSGLAVFWRKKFSLALFEICVPLRSIKLAYLVSCD
jgi:hypothetical protein